MRTQLQHWNWMGSKRDSWAPFNANLVANMQQHSWDQVKKLKLSRYCDEYTLNDRFVSHMRLLKLLSIIPVLVCTSAAVLADGGEAGISLWEAHDPGLQKILNQTLDRLHLKDAVARNELAVTLVDISDLSEPRVADANGNHMMYAASLPKIAILLAACVEIERGALKLTPELQESMTRMIRNSSNADATAVLNLVGKRRVNAILQDDRFRLYDPQVDGGLWVGKEYAQGVAFQRDPLHNISHGATATQVARFYYMLETGQLVNPELTAVMKEILSRPAIQHKFVKGLAGQQVEMYRKSGTWHQFHADSALIEGDGFRYILVALAENPAGGQWLVQLPRMLHRQIAPQRLALNATNR
ncbi:MAG: serine hydrolase [Gammaproteobacteria bacterium]|nr:serine hydrolase [Gammaproteobacteria bacterium]